MIPERGPQTMVLSSQMPGNLCSAICLGGYWEATLGLGGLLGGYSGLGGLARLAILAWDSEVLAFSKYKGDTRRNCSFRQLGGHFEHNTTPPGTQVAPSTCSSISQTELA